MPCGEPARAELAADADANADLVAVRRARAGRRGDRDAARPGEGVDAADRDAGRQVERTGDRSVRVLADQRDGHVFRVDVGDGERQRALDDRPRLQLHARAGVDRGHDVHPDRPGHEVDEAAEDVGDILLGLLHVEHQVRRLARGVGLGVVGTGSRRQRTSCCRRASSPVQRHRRPGRCRCWTHCPRTRLPCPRSLRSQSPLSQDRSSRRSRRPLRERLRPPASAGAGGA